MTETKKKSVREKRIPGTLPLTTLSVLRRVVNGEALLATRRFPYDWEYRFDAQGTKVGIMAISALIEGGYLTATQRVGEAKIGVVLGLPTALSREVGDVVRARIALSKKLEHG